jgi:hypothetical protein
MLELDVLLEELKNILDDNSCKQNVRQKVINNVTERFNIEGFKSYDEFYAYVDGCLS